MRILIDGHMLGTNEGGNERYAANLYKYLAAEKEIEAKIIVAKNYPKSSGIAEKNLVRMSVDNDLYRLLFFIPQKVAENHVNVLHSTYILPFLKNCKFILSVHDLLFMRRPELFSIREKLIFRFLFPWSISRADAVIVPSNFTKKEMVKFYPQHVNKTFVVHYGVGEEFRRIKDKETITNLLERFGITAPFLLTINSKHKKKNIRRVIQAFLLLLEKHPGLKLVVVGGSANIEEGYKKIKNIIILDYISDRDLITLYSSCRIFIYYSLYEGFGLPILEAVCCSALVICSDIPVHREITSGKVPLANPQDHRDLFKKINLILSNSLIEKKTRLEEQGLCEAFNWYKTAKETMEVYKYIFSK